MTELVFPERSLKPCAEPVDAAVLREGEVYFSLNFVDPEMRFPILEPLVYIGRNLVDGDDDVLYLQDLESYREGERFDADGAEERAVFYRSVGQGLSHIFEFEQALDVLLACSLKR